MATYDQIREDTNPSMDEAKEDTPATAWLGYHRIL